MSGAVNRFPPGWDEARVRDRIEHYESQTEDEAAFDDRSQTVMLIPTERVPAVRALLPASRDATPPIADSP